MLVKIVIKNLLEKVSDDSSLPITRDYKQ